MTRIWEWLGRIPLAAPFAFAAVLQVALVSLMVFDRVQILREGVEVKLQTQPVDPRDFLRGDYVRLSYVISSAPVAAFVEGHQKGKVFVKIAPKADGFYEIVSVHRSPPGVAGTEKVIQGRVPYVCVETYCRGTRITYGLERYFVPQGEGLEIERAPRGSVSIVAAVTPSGRAAIKRLLLDGKPIYEEPLF